MMRHKTKSRQSLTTLWENHKVTGTYSVKLSTRRSSIPSKMTNRNFLVHFKANFWEKMQHTHVIWVHVSPLHRQASHVRLAPFHLAALCRSFRAKSNKIFQLFMIQSALTLDWSARLQLRALVSLRDALHVSPESAALDGEESVYRGFDGFNHSNYTSWLTPQLCPISIQQEGPPFFMQNRRSGPGNLESPLHLRVQDAVDPKRLHRITSSRIKNLSKGGEYKNSAPAAFCVSTSYLRYFTAVHVKKV